MEAHFQFYQGKDHSTLYVATASDVHNRHISLAEDLAESSPMEDYKEEHLIIFTLNFISQVFCIYASGNEDHIKDIMFAPMLH